MSTPRIETPSLTLVPHSPQHLRALIEGAGRYTACFGAPPAEGLCDFFASKDVSPAWLARLALATETDVWTHGFALLHRESGSVIGACSFKGPPGTDGVVEISYGVVPVFQGRGYATEAARAAVDFAFASGRVRIVRAHTLTEVNASTRVLTKCGFRCVGEVVEPEDGIVWRWEQVRAD